MIDLAAALAVIAEPRWAPARVGRVQVRAGRDDLVDRVEDLVAELHVDRAEPWGFAVEDISRPVLLLHGEGDRFVPVSHGHWLAARIPGVEARIDAADGHLTLFERRMREVNAWLLSHS
jgi:pimeloyl-ACP methyl ester carboxylesterase